MLFINIGKKYVEYFMMFVCICDYRLIMNLIFRTVRLRYFITIFHIGISFFLALSRHYKQYHQVHFLIILFGKMPSNESLSSSGTESEINRLTGFEMFGLQPYSLEPTK